MNSTAGARDLARWNARCSCCAACVPAATAAPSTTCVVQATWATVKLCACTVHLASGSPGARQRSSMLVCACGDGMGRTHCRDTS
jgi:hypothetical protein